MFLVSFPDNTSSAPIYHLPHLPHPHIHPLQHQHPPPAKKFHLSPPTTSVTYLRQSEHTPTITVATSSASGTSVPFSPMEQMEELDVVAAYCYDEDMDNLEKALGIDFQDPSAVQRELMAK